MLNDEKFASSVRGFTGVDVTGEPGAYIQVKPLWCSVGQYTLVNGRLFPIYKFSNRMLSAEYSPYKKYFKVDEDIYIEMFPLLEVISEEAAKEQYPEYFV